MFNKILVPLDGSSLAGSVLPHVITLAQTTGAEVILAHVIEQNSTPDRVRSLDPVNWRLRQVEAETYLDGVKHRLQDIQGIGPVTTVFLEGQAAEWITDFAHEHNVDLIMLSSHGRSGLTPWNISGTAQKIIWRAYTSIFLARAYHQDQANQQQAQYRRTLVPLDGSQRAEFVLPVVTALSQKLGTELLLAHVIARPDTPRRMPLTPEEQELIERLIERNREEIDRYFNHLKSRLPGEVQTRVLVSDSTTATLHQLVDDEAADLIILSAHGYSGQKKHSYGSVGINLMMYGTTPLLIVQDLPRQEIERTQAEIASQHGNLNGGRTLIYDKPPS